LQKKKIFFLYWVCIWHEYTRERINYLSMSFTVMW
jgi:hypothetical protein